MSENTNKSRILIVDDDIDLASLYKMRLTTEGYDVTHSANSETALQTAREFLPDLIILDLMMPRVSGFDAIDLFRNTAETKHAKIVIMSALSQPEDIQRTKELGADDYIIKSNFTINEVVMRIKQVLGDTQEPIPEST